MERAIIFSIAMFFGTISMNNVVRNTTNQAHNDPLSNARYKIYRTQDSRYPSGLREAVSLSAAVPKE